MTTFAEGFGRGVESGVYLSREMRERGKARATRTAMEALAEAENYDPTVGQFDPAVQGVPEEGQPARKPNQGYSGEDFAAIENRFFSSLNGFSDMEDYGKAKLAWGAMKQSKINDAGMAAINAYDRGDMAGAKKMLATASAYIAPGFTPEIEVDPKSGAFIIASYDGEGNPHSGAAMTRDDLVDFFRINSGPAGVEAWADSQQRGKQFNQTLGLNYERFAEDKRHNRQAELLAQNQDDRAATKAQADAATALLSQQLTGLQIDDAKKAQIEKQIANIRSMWVQSATYNKTEAEEYKASHQTHPGVTDSVLLGAEGGQWDSKNDVEGAGGRGHYGRIQFSRARFNEAKAAGAVPNGLSIEEFATEAHKEDQINAEAWHWYDIDEFISNSGLGDRFLGKKDANGTPITWAGMRFAAHIAGKDGLRRYLETGSEEPDVNGKGPASYMKLGLEAAPAGPDAAPTQEGLPTEPGLDYAGALIGDETTKKPPDEMAMDPWFYNDPDASGKVTERTEIWNAMELMAADLKENNPEASDRQIASMTFDAFGPKPRGTLDPGDPASGDDNYYSDGVSKLKVSERVAGLMANFEVANTELRQRFEAQNNPKPYEVYDQDQPAQQQEAIPVSAPAPALAAPGAAAAAAAPAPAPAPAAGIPEPGVPTARLTVDDTAVRTAIEGAYNQGPAPVRPKGPIQTEAVMPPPLAAAVRELSIAVARGQPSDAAMAKVQEILKTLPPQLAAEFTQSIQQMLGGR